jgi:membrane dipeptidase
MSDEELRAYADTLAHRYIITDGHIDFPSRLIQEKRTADSLSLSIAIGSSGGDFDYNRAKKGGLDAPFMSIYIPSSYQSRPDMGKGLADSLINLVEGVAKFYPEQYALAATPDEVIANFKSGKISLPMGMENGAPVRNDLANVGYFHSRGIRYITLTHGKDNQICDSSYDTTHVNGGLSDFGRQVVAEMNKVGIMVDISHVDDNTFRQVMEITQAPVIASHSSCRAFTPGFERNMSDDMIVALGKNGGVIQINFGSSFLDSTVAKSNNEARDQLRAILNEKKLSFRDSLARPIIDEFRKSNPTKYADVETVADHIDHVVKLAGIDHVGIGSDYDGVGDSLPTGLKDVSQFPNLIYALLKRGYTESDIEKICSGNVFRVWNEVIRVAAQM